MSADKTAMNGFFEKYINEQLKMAFAEAAKNNMVVEFAKEHGVETTMGEIQAFLNERKYQDEELSPEELENAAGGTCNGSTGAETVLSVMGLGVACVLAVCQCSGWSCGSRN